MVLVSGKFVKAGFADFAGPGHLLGPLFFLIAYWIVYLFEQANLT